MKARFLYSLAAFAAFYIAFISLAGCQGPLDEEKQKQDADPDYAAKVYLRTNYMNVYYYWYKDVKNRNEALKPYNYNIYDFFDAMLYQKDHWSWMCDKEEYTEIETGVITGTWGVSLSQPVEFYDDYSIVVRYIYPGSPFEKFGVTRGAVMTHIAGKNISDDETGFTPEKLNIFNTNYYVSPQTFTFRLTNGRDTTFTTEWASSLATKSYLEAKVIQPSEFKGLTTPVGYFHYLTFNANFLDDINNAMKTFHDTGVKNLIVDLRYNGGGDARASDLLVNYLAPKSAINKAYVTRKHNDYLPTLDKGYSDENNTTYIKGNSNSLDLDRIYFITGSGTASASEMVINGLKPYFGDKLQMVGDTTYGKPNGMYVLMYPGESSDYKKYNAGDYSGLKWVFLPICFYNMNSNGEQIPDTGFLPDNVRPDDVYHDFCVEEGSINACLTHIVTSSYPAIPAGPKKQTKSNARRRATIKTEEDDPHYGLCLVK